MFTNYCVYVIIPLCKRGYKPQIKGAEVTKDEEKQLIAQGWEKSERNEIDFPKGFGGKKIIEESWSKEFMFMPIIFAPAGTFTKLCVGIFFYDETMNELHLFYLKNDKFHSLFYHKNYNASTEWVFGDIWDNRIKRKNFKIKSLYEGDDYYGKNSLSASFYTVYDAEDEAGVMVYNHTRFFDPENLLDDMYKDFNTFAMNDFSKDEVVYKKYKLNKRAAK